jgi:hypothetical protein
MSKAKIRKYQEEFIKFGFHTVTIDGVQRPKCLICSKKGTEKILANSMMKPAYLEQHFRTQHPKEYKEMDIGKLKKLLPVTVEERTTDEKGIELSSRVSYIIAKHGKPYMDADVYLKDVMRATLDIYSPQSTNEALSAPLSNNTVKRRIDAIFSELQETLLTRVRRSKYFAIQLDESTDISGYAQLLVFVRFEYQKAVEEEILFCKPLETTTKGNCFSLSISKNKNLRFNLFFRRRHFQPCK